jgi:hypothetical protein
MCPGFLLCSVYPRFGGEEAGSLEITTGTEKRATKILTGTGIGKGAARIKLI